LLAKIDSNWSALSSAEDIDGSDTFRSDERFSVSFAGGKKEIWALYSFFCTKKA
jgi:hypothetical protein